MAITVQLYHTTSTFQRGEKRGSSFPHSTSSMEVVVWNDCTSPSMRTDNGKRRRAWSFPCGGNGPVWHSCAASVYGQLQEWRVTWRLASVTLFAFLGLRTRACRDSVSSVLARGAWWHHDHCSPTMETDFSPPVFPISALSSLSLHSPTSICSAEILLFANLSVVMLKGWISYTKQSAAIAQRRGENRQGNTGRAETDNYWLSFVWTGLPETSAQAAGIGATKTPALSQTWEDASEQSRIEWNGDKG